MCRNIKTLHNFQPPATDAEIRASSLQVVRKLSGFTRPSRAPPDAFDRAVHPPSHAARGQHEPRLTPAPPRARGEEASMARAQSPQRFRTSAASHAT
jgi:hypothetical protein